MLIRLLQHDDSVNRELDGAVKFEDLASIFQLRVASSLHWSIRTWPSFLHRGGGIRKRFQYCVDPSSLETFLYFRAIQGHSGGTRIDPTLQGNVLFPGRLRRAHPSRWKLPQLTFHHPVCIIQCALIQEVQVSREMGFWCSSQP